MAVYVSTTKSVANWCDDKRARYLASWVGLIACVVPIRSYNSYISLYDWCKQQQQHDSCCMPFGHSGEDGRELSFYFLLWFTLNVWLLTAWAKQFRPSLCLLPPCTYILNDCGRDSWIGFISCHLLGILFVSVLGVSAYFKNTNFIRPGKSADNECYAARQTLQRTYGERGSVQLILEGARKPDYG